jgi:ribosomal-protein-alanine N-acetyltransferase
MAVGLFQCELSELGIDNVFVKSAGTAAAYGEPASENALRVMLEEGFCEGAGIDTHMSKPLNAEECEDCFAAVCMTPAHAVAALKFFPPERLIVLAVSDPFGGDIQRYRDCRDEIKAALPGILYKNLLPLILKDGLYSVCPMQKEHSAALEVLEKECFGTAAWSKTALLNELSNKTALFLVATAGRIVFGYVGCHIVLDECTVTNVAVFEQFRRCGIAKTLIETLKNAAQKRGVKKIFLEVRQSNENAKKLYEECGFEQLAIRKGFYSEPKEDADVYVWVCSKA